MRESHAVDACSAARLCGIAADDYDALVRFCKGMKESENKAAMRAQASMDKTDDAYRMLPMRVQQHVLDVTDPDGSPRHAGRKPATTVAHVESLGSEGGKHRLAVHSRISGGHGNDTQTFDSVIVIGEAGDVKVESLEHPRGHARHPEATSKSRSQSIRDRLDRS